MSKITAIVHTYNAEQHLRRALQALQGFDELLVVDMESTDSTTAIAAEMGARIITFAKGNYNVVEYARQYGIDNATHPWILEVDADEIVPEALRRYIYDLISRPDAPAGLWIPIRNRFMGKEIKSDYPCYILRFFKREGTTWPAHIHARPHVNGEVKYLPKGRKDLAFIHLSDPNVSSRLCKLDGYTNEELLRKNISKVSILRLFWRPTWRFFKSYILSGGFRDGRRGVAKAWFDAIYQVVILTKAIEREQKNSEK